jgi:hypothetical protein
MDSCSLLDFLPGTKGDGRRRYTLQEMLCMRATCLDKPSGMQDYAKDGSLMQCSLLDGSSNPFNWEQLSGLLQVRVLQGRLASAASCARSRGLHCQQQMTAGFRLLCMAGAARRCPCSF